MTLYARPSFSQPLCVVREYVAGRGYATFCNGRFELAVQATLTPTEPVCGGCWMGMHEARDSGPEILDPTWDREGPRLARERVERRQEK